MRIYSLEEIEKIHILATLKELNCNRKETSRVLDINQVTLYRKLKKYEKEDGISYVRKKRDKIS
jgi:DNA-binding NtrC family response regulator